MCDCLMNFFVSENLSTYKHSVLYTKNKPQDKDLWCRIIPVKNSIQLGNAWQWIGNNWLKYFLTHIHPSQEDVTSKIQTEFMILYHWIPFVLNVFIWRKLRLRKHFIRGKTYRKEETNTNASGWQNNRNMRIGIVPFNFCWKLDPDSIRTPPILLAKLKSFDTLKIAINHESFLL